MECNEIKEAISTFIKETFVYDDETAAELSDRTNLIDDGIVDSFGIHEILGFLEAEFTITVEDAEVVPENFSSIEALCNFVCSKNHRNQGDSQCAAQPVSFR